MRGVFEENHHHIIPTLFVDNLPHHIRKIWVFNLFSRYGKIRDIFIPNKLSKVTGNSFGFVRFYRQDDAAIAVAEINNSWYWDLRLTVKFARFLRKEDKQGLDGRRHGGHSTGPVTRKQTPQVFFDKSIKIPHIERRGKEVWRKKGLVESSKHGEVRNGKCAMESAIENPQSPIKIKIQPSGFGWLYRSALAKISKLVSTTDLEHIFRKEKVQNVQIKSVGGRFVIVIFPDRESRDSTITEKWLSNWFEAINPWCGEQAKVERFVWLSCFGMPLNAWSVPTFKEIGSNWGQFLQVDESTLKEKSYAKGRVLIATEHFQKIEGTIELIVEGKSFLVHVEEENSFRTINHSHFSGNNVLPMDKTNEGKVAENNDDMDRVVVGVEVSKDLNDKEDVKAASLVGNNTDALSSTSSSTLGIASSSVGGEIVMDSFGDNPLSNCLLETINEDGCKNTVVIVDNNITTPGNNELIEESSLEMSKVVATEDKDLNEENQSENVPQLDLFEENQIPIQAAIKGVKGKKKRKNIDEILGLSKVKPVNQKGGRNKSKCVVFRSAVAAAALSASISSEGINNRNRILLDKAQAIWKINKIMGIGYDGDEEEVISKIAELEAQNEERAASQI